MNDNQTTITVSQPASGETATYTVASPSSATVTFTAYA